MPTGVTTAVSASRLCAPSVRCRVLGAALAVACLLPAPRPAGAQLFLTQEEALELAFPDADRIDRRTAFLSEEELERADRVAGERAEVRHEIVTYYVATRAGSPLGAAYFDAHRVRTLPEVVMITVRPDRTIGRIEILKFSEPPDYIAPEGWLDQLEGRSLGPELSLKGEVVNMTGATLTSRAITSAARRVLALHRVIAPFGSGSDGSRARAPEPEASEAGASKAASSPGRPHDGPSGGEDG